MAALLAGETLEMVDVAFRLHDHLERRDHLGASRAVPGRTEQSAYGNKAVVWTSDSAPGVAR